MTPKREAYLKKCGKWEKKYREWIKLTEERIKEAKHNLNAGVDVEWEKSILRSQKVYLSWYRHELNRLKGMDRVVVPRIEGNPAIAFCKCGHTVGLREYETIWFDKELFCSNCGRRILWEKVSK